MSGSNCVASSSELVDPNSAGTSAPPSGVAGESTSTPAAGATSEPAVAGAGGASEPAAGASGSAGAEVAAAGAAAAPMSKDPCAGRADGFLCDENVMLRCSAGMTMA
ncbi:MAG TPA: hypothetical protein VJR89_08985, partial [Polyangiales bacterium]|nr:hypothetical protein [Polyangiales bacterium]